MLKISSKRIFLFIAVIGLLIFLHFTNILSPIENASVFIFKPFTNVFYSLSTNFKADRKNSQEKDQLLEQIGELEQENRALLAENSYLKTLEEENNTLRNHLNFLSKSKENYLLANVVSQGVFLDKKKDEKILVIDRGSKNGVTEGLAIVNSEGIIIGKVAEVDDYISKVYLLINNNCKLAAMVENQDKTSGITEGDLGLTIKMNFIPQTENINVGDIVVTSGLEDKIPRGLVIGKIIQVNKENNEVWQSAVIEPLAETDNLSIVSILMR